VSSSLPVDSASRLQLQLLVQVDARIYHIVTTCVTHLPHNSNYLLVLDPSIVVGVFPSPQLLTR